MTKNEFNCRYVPSIFQHVPHTVYYRTNCLFLRKFYQTQQKLAAVSKIFIQNSCSHCIQNVTNTIFKKDNNMHIRYRVRSKWDQTSSTKLVFKFNSLIKFFVVQIHCATKKNSAETVKKQSYHCKLPTEASTRDKSEYFPSL